MSSRTNTSEPYKCSGNVLSRGRPRKLQRNESKYVSLLAITLQQPAGRRPCNEKKGRFDKVDETHQMKLRTKL